MFNEIWYPNFAIFVVSQCVYCDLTCYQLLLARQHYRIVLLAFICALVFLNLKEIKHYKELRVDGGKYYKWIIKKQDAGVDLIDLVQDRDRGRDRDRDRGRDRQRATELRVA